MELHEFSDQELEQRLRSLTDRISGAIKHREDIIEELVQRGVRDKRLGGFGVVMQQVAEKLGVPVPDLAELPERQRDETYWWTNITTMALMIEKFLPPQSTKVRELLDDYCALRCGDYPEYLGSPKHTALCRKVRKALNVPHQEA